MTDVMQGLYAGGIPPLVSIACLYVAVYLIRSGRDYILLSLLKIHLVIWIVLTILCALIAAALMFGVLAEGLKYALGYALACFCVNIAAGGIAVHKFFG